MGGGGPTAEKQPQQRFFKPSTDFTVIHGGSNILQGGGVQHFQGGGVQMLISIKTHITCDFLEGVLTPCPPLDPRMFEQSLPLEVSKSSPESLSLRPLDLRKSIQSPRHCNSRLVKVSRVPVIATRGQ